jgi:hypothetical protein
VCGMVKWAERRKRSKESLQLPRGGTSGTQDGISYLLFGTLRFGGVLRSGLLLILTGSNEILILSHKIL